MAPKGRRGDKMQRKKQELSQKQRKGTKQQASQTSSNQKNRRRSRSPKEEIAPFTMVPTKRLRQSVDENKLTDLIGMF